MGRTFSAPASGQAHVTCSQLCQRSSSQTIRCDAGAPTRASGISSADMGSARKCAERPSCGGTAGGIARRRTGGVSPSSSRSMARVFRRQAAVRPRRPPPVATLALPSRPATSPPPAPRDTSPGRGRRSSGCEGRAAAEQQRRGVVAATGENASCAAQPFESRPLRSSSGPSLPWSAAGAALSGAPASSLAWAAASARSPRRAGSGVSSTARSRKRGGRGQTPAGLRAIGCACQLVGDGLVGRRRCVRPMPRVPVGIADADRLPRRARRARAAVDRPRCAAR